MGPSSHFHMMAGGMAKRALLTYAVFAASVALTFCVWFDGGEFDWEAYERWGALRAWDIYGGAYWALLLSVFFHGDYLHLGFNLYWLWVLSRPLERALGPWRWLALFVASAWVSSAAQLALSGDTGIGLSGVGYAQIGFMWLAQERFPQFKQVVDRKLIIVFVIWMLWNFLASIVAEANVGNAAHFWGLVFGVAAGSVTRARWRNLAAEVVVVLCVTATLTVLWAPWSADWTAVQAESAHDDARYEDALAMYRRCIELEFHDPGWVWDKTAVVCFHLEDRIGFDEALMDLRPYDADRAREWAATWPPPGRGTKR